MLGITASASATLPPPGPSGTASFRVAVTVPTTSIAADLAAFPVYVSLANMPSEFWTNLYREDGGDIRVRDAADADVPFDLVRLEPGAQTGSLFFLADLSDSVDTVYYIHYGSPLLTPLAPAASNGRNATWAGYDRVFLFGATLADRTGNGAYPTIGGTAHAAFALDSTSANTGCHQGVAWDGTYFYVVDNNTIKKYDAAMSLVTTNSNPLSGISGVNHCGDPEAHAGMIYIPVETYVDISTWSGMKIARYSAATLAFIDVFDVSAQAHEVSSIAYNELDDRMYVTSFADGSKLFMYDPDTLSYLGSLSLSATVAELQGITFWQGAIWLNSDNVDGTLRVELDGTVRQKIFGATGGSYEGLSHTSDALLVFHDTSGSATGVIKKIRPYSVEGGGGLDLGGSTYLKSISVSLRTSWTIGATMVMDVKSQNRGVASYDLNSSSGNTNRATLAYRSSSDRFGIWNTTDSWLLDGGAAPSTATSYRIHMVQATTASRKLYRAGALAATQSSVTQKPTSASALYMGAENETNAESLDGRLGFVYLRNGALSADWIAAEVANLTTPASFYTVGAEEAL